MSHVLHGENVAASAHRRPFSWRALLARLAATTQIWRSRQRQRRELLDFLATDHRAASDLGINRGEAREWVDRPFWRA
jgi:uncharacterized protein YjiS (DUF1127 family)